MTGLLLVAALLSPLDALRAESARYPQDYAAAVRLAEAAEARGAHRLACQGWRRANTASDGALPALLGEARCRLALGEHPRAVALAEQLQAVYPHHKDTHLIVAEVRRTNPGPLHAGLDNELAAQATARAVALAPRDPLANCAHGWARLRLGDRRGARAAFGAADAACAHAGQAAAAPTWRAQAGAYVTGTRFSGNRTAQDGRSTLLDASLALGDLFEVGVAARRAASTAEVLGDAQTYTQDELWVRAALSHAGHGLRLIGAKVSGGGDSDLSATVLGGQVWATWWATLRLEGAYTSYSDAEGWQLSASAYLPLLDWLHLEAGVGATSLTHPADARLEHARTGLAEAGDVLTHGVLAAHLVQPRWRLTAGARLGSEIRPARLDEPTLWNLTDRVRGGGFVRGTYTLTDWVSVYGNYEAMRLQDPFDDTTSEAHAFTGGLTLHFGGRL